MSRSLADRVVDQLRHNSSEPQRAQDLSRALRVRPADRRAFKRLLEELVEEGRVVRMRRGRYAVPDRTRRITGVLAVTRRGHGFVAPDNGDPDVHVAPAALGGGLNGDRVAVRLEGAGRDGQPDGRIVEVLDRARRTVVGRYRLPAGGRRQAFVEPEDRRIAREIGVAGGLAAEAGDMVVVRITDWGDDRHRPVGDIDRVLGRADAPGVDVLSIIHGHELPTDFEQEVVAEAEALRDRGIQPSDLEGREDLRDRLVVTIDPPDAKDHDDALSIRNAGDGLHEVGIHIADVSFYVRTGSAIDREARSRGTSVYLVDRAIPMLPEALSSDLCSLVPGRDRLTQSVLLTIGADGVIHAARFARTIIRSRHKLSYAEAQRVLDGSTIDPETDAMLRALRDVSRGLRLRRTERGSLDFDLPEARVFLDESGAPVDVQRAERWDSHRLVEDFMLAANEAVGGRTLRDEVPSLYRIHEPPDAVRLSRVAGYARALGFEVHFREDPTPAQLQALLGQKPGLPSAGLLAMLVLRSMKQARYAAHDLGHYGLAARGYTHFTSPIRRYPDLIVHRIIAARYLGSEEPADYDTERLEELAGHASARERVAADAERDSIQLKKLRFMAGHLGSVFDGTISDVRKWGLGVLLDDFFIEGWIHVSALEDDYYEWVEERFLLVGRNSGRRFRVGERIRVRVSGVDTEERRVDFIPEREGDPPRKERNRRKRR